MKIANDRLPTAALPFFIGASLFGLRILLFPADLVAVAGRDAWISLLAAAGVIIADMVAIALLVQRFPGQSLVEISQTVFGQPLGLLVTLFYLAVWLVHIVRSAHQGIAMVRDTMLPETPDAVLAAWFLIVPFYLATNGIEPVGRYIAITFPLIFLTLLSFLAGTLAQTGQFENLLPVLAEGWTPVWQGLWAILPHTDGIEITLILAPYLFIRRLVPITLVSAAVAVTPAFVAILTVLVAIPVKTVAMHTYPTLSAISQTQTPGLMTQRLDFIFLAIWLVAMVNIYTIYTQLCVLVLERLFPRNRTRWIFPALVVTLAFIPHLFTIPRVTLETFVEPYWRLSVLAATYILPVGMLLVAALRGVKGGDAREAA